MTQVMKTIYRYIMTVYMIYYLHNDVECGLGNGNSCW